MASDSDVSVELRLHHGVKLDVLRRTRSHNFSRKIRRDVFVEPRLLLRLALPNLAHGESTGRRIRNVDDEAGLLLHQLVESGGRLVVRRWSIPVAVTLTSTAIWSPFAVRLRRRLNLLL